MQSGAGILVVEDNKENLELVSYLLAAGGYAPVLATNGSDGLRLAIELVPGLVLLDLRMPGMDGYEVASAIRTRSELVNTRIVAVTASAMISDRDRIVTAGFDGYIQKPIDPETFVDTVAQFLVAGPAATPIGGA
jgi:CheY-like chemotaxis protein